MKTWFKKDGNLFYFVYSETENAVYFIAFSGTDEEKVFPVKVRESRKDIFMENKRSFSAIGGARGLFQHIKKHLDGGISEKCALQIARHFVPEI